MKFTYVSPDGEQGFPGTLVTNIIYTVTETNGLIVSYHAVSDKKTLINLTNHNYFNLGGHESGTIENTKVRIYADEFTPINEDTIPTGEIRKVEHTPMDFLLISHFPTKKWGWIYPFLPTIHIHRQTKRAPKKESTCYNQR